MAYGVGCMVYGHWSMVQGSVFDVWCLVRGLRFGVRCLWLRVSGGIDLGGARVARRPHGGVRPVDQKSTCLTQLTLGPDVVQIWSRNGANFEPTKPSYSTGAAWENISGNLNLHRKPSAAEGVSTSAEEGSRAACENISWSSISDTMEVTP